MTRTDQRKESKCRLLTLLLILLVSVVGANKINSTGSYRPIFIGPNWISLFNQTSLPDKTKEGGVPTKISKVMLMNKESDRFVRIFQIGRNGIDATGIYEWYNKTTQTKELNPFAILIFTPNEDSQYPYFTIQGWANGYYLCFKKNGALVVKVKGQSRRCEFKEVYSSVDSIYKEIISNAFPNFKLGFKKSGKPLNGNAHSKTTKQDRFMFYIRPQHTNDPFSCKTEHRPYFKLCDRAFLGKLVKPKKEPNNETNKVRHKTKKGGHRNNRKRKR